MLVSGHWHCLAGVPVPQGLMANSDPLARQLTTQVKVFVYNTLLASGHCQPTCQSLGVWWQTPTRWHDDRQFSSLCKPVSSSIYRSFLRQSDAPVPRGRDVSSALFSRWGAPAPTHWHAILLWHRVLDNKIILIPPIISCESAPLLLSLFTSGLEGSWPWVAIAFKSFYCLPLTPPVRTIFLAYIQCTHVSWQHVKNFPLQLSSFTENRRCWALILDQFHKILIEIHIDKVLTQEPRGEISSSPDTDNGSYITGSLSPIAPTGTPAASPAVGPLHACLTESSALKVEM